MPSWSMHTEKVFYAINDSIEGAMETSPNYQYDTQEEARRNIGYDDDRHIFKVTQTSKVEMLA